MEEKKPEDYTIRKVNLDTGEKEVVRELPTGHMSIIRKQLKAQAQERQAEIVEKNKKDARRAKSKRARKARRKSKK